MQPIRIDAELAKKLQEAGREVPLVGPDGHPKGFFVSPDQYALLHALADELQEYQRPTIEELRKSLANPKRYSMDDVLRLFEGR
jgi:hypothetical protein